jgi:hypothetical protein
MTLHTIYWYTGVASFSIYELISTNGNGNENLYKLNVLKCSTDVSTKSKKQKKIKKKKTNLSGS